MAANAFVLINVDPECTGAVIEQLSRISGAVVHEVLGPYDIVVDIEADTKKIPPQLSETRSGPYTA